MREAPRFNPLDIENLARSVADALLAQDAEPMPPREKFVAAGVYAIYYRGTAPIYSRLVEANRGRPAQLENPIYVGKAVPKGARKGGLLSGEPPGCVLHDRMQEHAESIAAAASLNLSDFWYRALAVDSVWIPLGETLLIRRFAPLWNHVVEGFGNHDPGKGRHAGKRSDWDVLHPGRHWATRLGQGKKRSEIERSIDEFLVAQIARNG